MGPSTLPSCLPNDFHRQWCTRNATCFLKCPRVCKLWEYAGQALWFYCATEKIFTNYLPKLQSSTPAFLQSGRERKVGVVGRGGGGDKKKEGKEKREWRERGRKRGSAKDAFQSFSSNWTGGSWAQCEIIEVKGGSPSLVRKSWIRTVYQTIIFFWNREAVAGTILQMCLMSSGQKWAASNPPPLFKVSHQGLLLPPLLPGPSPPFFSGQLRPPPTDRLCIPGLWTHWQGPLWDPNQDPHVTGT